MSIFSQSLESIISIITSFLNEAAKIIEFFKKNKIKEQNAKFGDMFTGIIENKGVIKHVRTENSNKVFTIESELTTELKVDQSVSHDGVCLTVEDISDTSYQVTAIDETLKKTNLEKWQSGTVINLERCMQLNGRLDGHIVQGHVDTTALCIGASDKKGSWEYIFEISPDFSGLIIEKGSISVNGISLTIFNVQKNSFTVGIIPFTFHHTNMQYLTEGDVVNIEFDMIGKYVNRIASLNNSYL